MTPQIAQPTEAQVEAVARAIRDADPIPMSMFQMDEIRDLARAAITAYQATSLAGSGDVASVRVPAEPVRYRHKKRGTTYTLVGHAQVQCPKDHPLTEYEVVTVYRADVSPLDDESGLWVRRKAEFNDGRFELLASPSHPEDQAKPACSVWKSLSAHGNCRDCGHPKEAHQAGER